MEKQLQKYANRINNALENKDPQIRSIFKEVVDEMRSTIKGSNLYYSRDVFIDIGGTFENAQKDILFRSDDYIFEVSDDIEEHPGIIMKYKRNEYY